jgi:hypothetical protein
MHNRLTPFLICLLISEKGKKPQLLTHVYLFPNSSPLNTLLYQINEFHDLHCISYSPTNRDIPTGQVYAGLLTKTSYVLFVFFIHLVLVSTFLLISAKRCTSWSSTRCGLHRTPLTSYLLGPNILSSVFSNYCKLCLSVFVIERKLILTNEQKNFSKANNIILILTL